MLLKHSTDMLMKQGTLIVILRSELLFLSYIPRVIVISYSGSRIPTTHFDLFGKAFKKLKILRYEDFFLKKKSFQLT